jgi:hypothetical protein
MAHQPTSDESVVKTKTNEQTNPSFVSTAWTAVVELFQKMLTWLKTQWANFLSLFSKKAEAETSSLGSNSMFSPSVTGSSDEFNSLKPALGQ